MIHIYCGDGKGKTTAAIGLAVRMAGNGKRVRVLQFLKGSESGEITYLQNSEIEMGRLEKDCGFYWNMSDEEKSEVQKRHNELLRRALSDLDRLDMLVLDELFAAINCRLVDMELVKSVVEGCKSTELVMTGRNPDAYFTEKADYISEIKKIKHPFDKGVAARKGIEY